MTSQQPTPTGEGEQPYVRVVRGEPTDEELAALVAVLAARSGAARPAPRPVDAWNDRSRALRAPLLPGPSAWRSATLPG